MLCRFLLRKTRWPLQLPVLVLCKQGFGAVGDADGAGGAGGADGASWAPEHGGHLHRGLQELVEKLS